MSILYLGNLQTKLLPSILLCMVKLELLQILQINMFLKNTYYQYIHIYRVCYLFRIFSVFLYPLELNFVFEGMMSVSYFNYVCKLLLWETLRDDLVMTQG